MIAICTQAQATGLMTKRHKWTLITKELKVRPTCTVCKSSILFLQPIVSRLSDFKYRSNLFESHQVESYFYYDLSRVLLDILSLNISHFDQKMFFKFASNFHGKFGDFVAVPVENSSSSVVYMDTVMRVENITFNRRSKENVTKIGEYVAEHPNGILLKRSAQSTKSNIIKILTKNVSSVLLSDQF